MHLGSRSLYHLLDLVKNHNGKPVDAYPFSGLGIRVAKKGSSGED
jgi:hypothetical protein